MIHFLNIVLHAKNPESDWKAHLQWVDFGANKMRELHGYGTTPGEAADDAWRKYNGDRNSHIEEEWDWQRK